MAKITTLRWEDDQLAAVDRVRGDVPRERWLRRLAMEAVAACEGPVALPGALAVSAPESGVGGVSAGALERVKTAVPGVRTAAEVKLTDVGRRALEGERDD